MFINFPSGYGGGVELHLHTSPWAPSRITIYIRRKLLTRIANLKMEKEQINIDEEQVMTYNRQGVSGATTVLPEMEDMPLANSLTLDDRVHTLVDFLKRPVDILSPDFLWTTTQKAGDELIPTGISLPNDYFKNPMVSEKLKGFLGVTGTLKMRIMINAQKFQQGALMPYWIPNSSNMPGKTAMVRKSLSGKSGCAHVIINCDGGTEQDLAIPYVNQHMFHNLATGQGEYGKLFLTPFLQLFSATGTTVGVRIQMWMENPQPQFATSAIPAFVSSQSISQIEESNMHAGSSSPINKGGGLDVGRILNTVKTSRFTPSYLSRSLANVFQLMGFSKPTQTASIQRMEIRPASYMANYNGEFMGHKLALEKENELLGMDAPAGTKIDEMSINHLATIPTYYKTFSVNTLNHPQPHTEGAIVFTDRVHPMKFVPSFPTGVLNSTFLGYTAASFAQWRGGLTYHFTVAKTCFQTGTLRVSFLPGVYDDVPTNLKTAVGAQWQVERCYQATFDLKEKNEFSFTVPFPSTRPFLHCVNPWSPASSEVSLKNYCVGTLVMDVFIPFVAPPTVASQFEIAVWVSGAKDISFANPVAPTIFPYFDSNVVQAQSFSQQQATNRHSGGEGQPACGQEKSKGAFYASAYCTGEIVSSIKALMSRFGPFYFSNPMPTTTSIVISPYNFASPLGENTSEKLFDYMDYFSFLYAFCRGGVRFIMDPGEYTDTVWKIGMRSSLNAFYPRSNIPRANVVTHLPRQYVKGPSSMSLVRSSLEGFVSFEVPYYSLTHMTPVFAGEHNRHGVEESNYPLPLVTLIPRNSTPVELNIEMYRSCADDFRFMYIIGPPQVAILPSSVDPIPFQIAPASYWPVSVTRVKDDFQGLFGAPSSILVEGMPEVVFETSSQLLAINNNTTKLWCLPSNMVCGLARVNNQIKISTSNFVGASKLNLLTSSPLLYQTEATTEFNMVVVPKIIEAAPSIDFFQSRPVPCLTFEQGIVQLGDNNTSINIPGQGKVFFNTLFSLKIYMIVFTASDETLDRVVLLSPRTNIEVRRLGETVISYFVYDARETLLGRLAISFQPNTGFQNNIPTPSFTNGVELFV